MESHLLDYFRGFHVSSSSSLRTKCQTLKNGVLWGMIRLGPASYMVDKNKQGLQLTIVYLDHKRYHFLSVAYIQEVRMN